MKKLLIIIPTYNERNNIKKIIDKLLANLKNFSLLFIDDNSPDGTQKEIKNFMLKNNKIKLLTRKNKKGVGSAHKLGIKWGYKKKYLKIITMDCDGTHDPFYIKKILKKSNECDIVSTNRFIKKNSLSDWSYQRKFLTTFRYNLINFLFNKTLDSSGAFRCYNTKQVKLKDILKAKNNSYSFFWESMLILNEKYIVKEIPIKLYARYIGQSKMKISDIFSALFYLFAFYFKWK